MERDFRERWIAKGDFYGHAASRRQRRESSPSWGRLRADEACILFSWRALSSSTPEPSGGRPDENAKVDEQRIE
jgi:hypothetical protein